MFFDKAGIFLYMYYYILNYLLLNWKKIIGLQQSCGDHVYPIHSQYEIYLSLSIMTSF